MTRIPRTLTRSVTCRPSDGTQYRFRWMFGSKRRGVRRCECEIDRPKPGAVPRTWQMADTGSLRVVRAADVRNLRVIIILVKRVE